MERLSAGGSGAAGHRGTGGPPTSRWARFFPPVRTWCRWILSGSCPGCRTRSPPSPFPRFGRIVSDEAGHSADDLLDALDPEPLASASIGQVHRARLKDGDEVAIKVQRPGIRKIVEVDLEIMLHLATLAERHIEELAHHRPVKIVEEFARSIEKEMDYTLEATSMERVSRSFLHDHAVYIPKVYRELTTERVLVTEFVDGIKVSLLDRLDDKRLRPPVDHPRGADILLTQIFEHGFFHADPHPGNLFILPNNVVCLLDFGMMGTVDRKTPAESFVELVDAVVRRDEPRTTQVLLKLTLWEESPTSGCWGKDVADFMGEHLYKPLKDIQIGRLLQNMLELAARHRMRIPPEIFLMMKALSTVEGVGLSLDPDFDMIAHAEPFIKAVKLLALFSQAPEQRCGEYFRPVHGFRPGVSQGPAGDHPHHPSEEVHLHA